MSVSVQAKYLIVLSLLVLAGYPAHAGGNGYTLQELQRMTQTLYVPAPPGYVAPPPRPAEDLPPPSTLPHIEAMPGPPPTMYLPQHWGPNSGMNAFNVRRGMFR